MSNNFFKNLNTEQQNPNTLDIDICSTNEILQKLIKKIKSSSCC